MINADGFDIKCLVSAYNIVQQFGVGKILMFLKDVYCTHLAVFIDQKYSKNSYIIKYYNLTFYIHIRLVK